MMTGSQAVFRRFVCVDIELQLNPYVLDIMNIINYPHVAIASFLVNNKESIYLRMTSAMEICRTDASHSSPTTTTFFPPLRGRQM